VVFWILYEIGGAFKPGLAPPRIVAVRATSRAVLAFFLGKPVALFKRRQNGR
jgi:hypothetical protein